MLDHSKRVVFSQNMTILSKIAKYAPLDSQLLSVPPYLNAAPMGDPLHSLWAKFSRTNDNRARKVCNMITYLQGVNRSLAKAYAVHACIIADIQIDDASKINVFAHSNVVSEYDKAIRDFIGSLKVAVDHIILLGTTDSPKFLKDYDCIDRFLKTASNGKIFNLDIVCFLNILNTAGNFLKHDPSQFEESAGRLSLKIPSLQIIFNRNSKKHVKYYENIKQHSNKKIPFDDGLMLVDIDCDFLVKGFNDFYGNVNKKFFLHL